MLDIKSKDNKTTLFSTPAMTLEAGKSYTVIVTRSAKGKLEGFTPNVNVQENCWNASTWFWAN